MVSCANTIVVCRVPYKPVSFLSDYQLYNKRWASWNFIYMGRAFSVLNLHIIRAVHCYTYGIGNGAGELFTRVGDFI